MGHLVPKNDKGKAFSFVALIQYFDVIISTVACIEIYRASIGFFVGLVFIFGVATKLIALILILIQTCCISHSTEISNDINTRNGGNGLTNTRNNDENLSTNYSTASADDNCSNSLSIDCANGNTYGSCNYK